tara:strand:+ start:2971 stop:3993 length:1023 start_codon:yes stop_codon:yes gene_type:complete
MNQLANVLALAGRREDNAAHGGQVAHISAAEAELLKRMGGASTRNPVTGLPEYYTSGVTGNPGASTSAATTAAHGSANAGAAAANAVASALGLGVTANSGYGGHGMGFSVSAPSSSGTGSGVTGIGEGAVATDGGLGFQAVLGEGQGNYGQSMGNSPGLGSGGFGIVTTQDGTPVTTTDGVPVMHGNLSGRVANTAILPSDIANAKFFNQLGDAISPLSNVSMIVSFLAQMAQAQTPQNVANTRGAIALAGPGQGAPSGPAGGQYARPVDPKTKSRVPTELIDAIRNAAVKPPGTIKVSTDPVQVTSPLSQGLANVIASQTGRFSPAVERIREKFLEQLA